MSAVPVPAIPAVSYVPASFWRFLEHLRVDTKESKEITLSRDKLLGTQRYFLEEVFQALDEGIHYIVVLKGRQLGITTICLALDLYWMFRHGGLAGSLVTHDEETRDMFKNTLTMYIDGLPPRYRVPVSRHNRNELVLKNRSRFAYQVAGTRKNSKLGKGKALSFLHATEVSEYGDEEGLASLEASLAETNPDRLYIFETTAQGYNHFYDLWETAKSSRSQKALFVGWWRNPYYRKKRGSIEHQVYWDGKLSPEERKWVREVKALYEVDIDDEQIAWWRWQVNEKQKDEILAYQNFPPTEQYAFVKTGSNFFNAARITEEYKRALKIPCHSYRFVLRENFEDTELNECGEKLANLKIWEFPTGGAAYALGADPAYGSSEWADRFCVAVYRCYADGMDLVAEFNTTDCSPYQFAWVICYLAGAYMNGNSSSAIVNLEINGPGQAVLTEMQNLRRIAAATPDGSARGLFNVIGAIQNFMYQRRDSFGAPSAYHTLSSNREKERMMGLFKDGFERGLIQVRSKECIDEMKNVVREDGFLGAPGRGKDDRIIASSLATTAWTDMVRLRLVSAGHTRAAMQKNAEQTAAGQTPHSVATYLKAIGVS